jgi:hypothetical protein
VTGLDKGLLRLFLLPAPRGLSRSAERQFDLMSMEEPRIGRASHPASAEERAHRLERAGDLHEMDTEAMAEALAEAMPAALVGNLKRFASGPTPDKPRPLRIPTDDMELALTPYSEDEQFRLTVQLIPKGGAGSAAGIRVRIRGPQGREGEATTDDDGRATLPFNPGDTEIIIEFDPPLALALDFRD